MKDLLIALFSSGIISYVLGWLSGKKKSRADLEGKRLENLETSIEIYERVHEELKEQLQTLGQRCKVLSDEISVLRLENISLKKEIHDLNERLKANKIVTT